MRPASHRTWGFLFAWDMSKDHHEKRPSAALNENTFKELLENKQYRTLRDRLVDTEPTDIADLLASVARE